MTQTAARRILVTGGQGQLAQALTSVSVRPSAYGFELHRASKNTLDITSASQLADYLDQYQPQAIINTAAYTHVDLAESHPEMAWQLNVLGPTLLARACRSRGITLLHISTDYVFDGSKASPWTEDDSTSALSVYGQTKRTGEQAILAELPDAIIVRTSWLFSEFGHNFLKTIMRLVRTQARLRIVKDQYGSPTYAPHLAVALLEILRRRFNDVGMPAGIYHFAGSPASNWYEFAQEIMKQAYAQGLLQQLPPMDAILTADYPTTAPRPRNSRLDTKKLQDEIGPLENDWRIGVRLSLLSDG